MRVGASCQVSSMRHPLFTSNVLVQHRFHLALTKTASRMWLDAKSKQADISSGGCTLDPQQGSPAVPCRPSARRAHALTLAGAQVALCAPGQLERGPPLAGDAVVVYSAQYRGWGYPIAAKMPVQRQRRACTRRREKIGDRRRRTSVILRLHFAANGTRGRRSCNWPIYGEGCP